MVVQVIEEKKLQTVCRNCRSTLSYQYSDIEEYYHTDYGGGRDLYRRIKCPVCEDHTLVSK